VFTSKLAGRSVGDFKYLLEVVVSFKYQIVLILSEIDPHTNTGVLIAKPLIFNYDVCNPISVIN
jgi:hypothetical protein